MLIFDISEFAKDSTKVLKAALNDDVIISNSDGNNYKLVPVKKDESPFDNVVPVNLGINTQEIVEIIRECRAGV
ncbi:MAG: hypothetical protein FWC97_03820 [Treponema sp.]|nr:hypothetical protein [Treponema sp.]